MPGTSTGKDSFSPAEKTSARIFELNRYTDDTRASADLVKTVKDALGEIDSVLHKMRALSLQASGEKMTPFERVLAQKAIEGYIADIDRIAEETEVKAAQLFSGFPPDPTKPLH